MDQETPEGAEQAFRYYWAVQVWAYQTGEPEELGSLGSDACSACAEYVATIDAMAEDERLWSRATIRDDDAATKSDPEGQFDLCGVLEFTVSAHREFDPGSGEDAAEWRLLSAATAALRQFLGGRHRGSDVRDRQI